MRTSRHGDDRRWNCGTSRSSTTVEHQYDLHRTINAVKRSYPAVLAVTGVALFMIVLDNLIVLSSLPSIEHSRRGALDDLARHPDGALLAGSDRAQPL